MERYMEHTRMNKNVYADLVDEIFLEVVDKIIRNGAKVNKTDLVDRIARVKNILVKGKNKDISEIIDSICENYYQTTDNIVNTQKLTPGLSSSIMLQNGFGVTAHIGRINTNNQSGKINDWVLFDIASITKIFTSILILKLYEEGQIDIYKMVNEIDPKYKNINIRLLDMLRFNYTIETKDRIDMRDELGNFIYTQAGAHYLLKNATVANNNFLYSDIPYMIASDLIPNFEDQIIAYFNKELQMSKTMFNPDDYDTTGGQIGKQQIVNDPKAQVIGGVSGHAGLFSTSKDLTKILNVLINMDPKLIWEMTRIRNCDNEAANENKLGMVYIKHPNGLADSEVPNLSAYQSIATAGITGGWALYDIKNEYTTNFLSNPLSNDTGKKAERYVFAMDPFKEEMVYTAFMLEIANKVLSTYYKGENIDKNLTKHL